MRMTSAALCALLALSCASTTTNTGTTSDQDVEWTAFANDAGGTHYSPAAQITRENVAQLRPAWTYHTGALQPVTDLNRKAAFEATPLMLGGTLYVVTPFNKVIALDPGTGAERWTYDPGLDRSYTYSEVTSRGVSAWRTASETRLYLGTLDGRLIALDAKTGKPCPDFGHFGQIDLKRDAGTFWAPDYAVTSPPAVVGDLVVVGSSIGDNSNVDTGNGVVRAFDVRTGALRWSFDPLLPMRDGSRAGAANAWAPIAADAKRGLVFIPTSSPSPDYFGGLRPGDDRYANSVVAIDAKSGKVAWHFQVVHHDLWDYDVASQPTLVDVGSTPAIAVTTKMGHVFLLDRRDGKPLWPVEERAVPKSDVAGEVASPTQPFPANPALGQEKLEAWGMTPDDEQWCAKRLGELRYEGIFTPPSIGGTLVYPSNVGGVNWSGSSYDPAHGLLIIPVNRLPVAMRLIPRAEYDSEQQKGSGNRMKGEFARQRGTPFGMYRETFVSPHELPCVAPPWGVLAAIDLRDGAKRWQVPMGKIATPSGKVIEGLPGFGGALVTGGGLVFIAGTLRDDTLYAHDVESGRVVWSAPLPAGGQSAPMTYRYAGKQYVVISAGGHAKAGTTMGDAVVAYALP